MVALPVRNNHNIMFAGATITLTIFGATAITADGSTITLAALGLISAILALVVTPLFKLLNANTRALDKVANASREVATATKKGAEEAKQRNGHLGDQNLKLAELVTAQNKDVVSIKDSTAKTAEILSKSALIAAEDRDILTSQVIKEQNVEHLHVEQSNLKEKA